MRDITLVFTSILITGFLGWNLVALCSEKEKRILFAFEKIGLSYLFGIGFVSLGMFIMSLFGIGFTRLSILFPWLVLLAGIGLHRILFHPLEKPVPEKDRVVSKGLSPFEIAMLFAISMQAIYNFFRALIKPIESYDAVAIYGLKSKIIYLFGSIPASFFQRLGPDFHGPHPDYPLLVPLAETWIYTFLGKFNDILIKAIFPLFFISFLFIFYSILKRITKNRSFSILVTFLLASVKQFSDYSTIAVTDLALGIYFALSLLYLYLWFGERERKTFLNISLAASILALWTKNEGMLLVSITLFILLIYTISNWRNFKKTEFTHVFIYIFLVIFMLTGWIAFKNYQGLINENFNLSMVNTEGVITGLNRIPAILYGYQKEFFGFKKWNIFWIIFMAIFIRQFKKAFSGNARYITFAIFLFFMGYFSMYVFSAVETRYFVRVTASRFLLHVFPVAMFWLAIMVQDDAKLKMKW